MARPTLKKGMSGKKGTEIGEAILLWRLFLGKPELKPAAGVTSYDFGAATDKYTREFQTSVGLPSNGVVNDAVWAVYDGRMSVAPPVVQSTARAVEAQGEANKAAAMAAAVAAKAAPKPAPKPTATPAAKPPVAPMTATTVKTALQSQVKNTVNTVKEAASTIASKAQAKKAEMPGWQRMLTVGLLGLAGLVGYKAVRK